MSSRQKNSDKKIFSYIGILMVIVVSFGVGIMFGRIVEPTGNLLSRLFSTSPSKIKEVSFAGNTSGEDEITEVDFDVFWSVWNIMKNEYVDASAVDEKEMFYSAIKGFVNSFNDPATVYLDPDETKTFNEGTEGKYFSGIGAELGYKDNQVVVISPLKGSPAEEAGLRAGDIIIAVDSEELSQEESLYDIVSKIRGEEGKEVVLTVVRKDSDKPFDILIVRGQITVPSMDYQMKDDIAVMNVSRFTDSSLKAWDSEWDTLVEEVLSKNPDGIILDLRGNPGGFFDAAVYAANDFLPKKTIVVKQEDREGRVKEFKVTRNGRLLDIPVVVVVNEGSASASEILAGALQMNSRAEVIGVETFGKGTAQSVIDTLPDQSSVHVTVAKWLLPDGSWLNHDNPIVPDKKVEFTDEQFKAGGDPQMDAALEILGSK
ncbi:S41 family peptidase [Candidatus Dojkabacteria bacterium]|uniref:S41 family peptidase n=1 Tax=Candidatus Dojkabacteria bacterium TaxID=2099670 RepID=A0A955I1K0_9BACT|nr:S41 family peptidase [Candidatus Dojkabacteria bacterium]MCB9790627.1 S41 family peptidase [Candidatus Nomurabacteria bacterium]